MKKIKRNKKTVKPDENVWHKNKWKKRKKENRNKKIKKEVSLFIAFVATLAVLDIFAHDFFSLFFLRRVRKRFIMWECVEVTKKKYPKTF